ncbi:hypothetical protein OROHE_012712 [Orobanche hederae]
MKMPFSRDEGDAMSKATRPPPASIPSSVHRSNISSPKRIFR